MSSAPLDSASHQDILRTFNDVFSYPSMKTDVGFNASNLPFSINNIISHSDTKMDMKPYDMPAPPYNSYSSNLPASETMPYLHHPSFYTMPQPMTSTM
ncbi:hypothetical protein X975_21122, partial [Stegodyphus mimosarum]